MAVPGQRVVRDVARLPDDVAEGVVGVGRGLAVGAGNGRHIAAEVVREGVDRALGVDVAFDPARAPDVDLISRSVLELRQQVARGVVAEREGVGPVARAVAEAQGVVGVGPGRAADGHGRHAAVLGPGVDGASVRKQVAVEVVGVFHGLGVPGPDGQDLVHRAVGPGRGDAGNDVLFGEAVARAVVGVREVDLRAVAEHFAGQVAVEVVRVRPCPFGSVLPDDLVYGVVGVLRGADLRDVADGVVFVDDAAAAGQDALGVARVGREIAAVDGDGAQLVSLPGIGERLSSDGIGVDPAEVVPFDGNGRAVLAGDPGQFAARIVIEGEVLVHGGVGGARQPSRVVVGIQIPRAADRCAAQESVRGPVVDDHVPGAGGA